MTTPNLCVDGLEFDDPNSSYLGDGNYAPFVIFDIDAQENLPGTYRTREEANYTMQLMIDKGAAK